MATCAVNRTWMLADKPDAEHTLCAPRPSGMGNVARPVEPLPRCMAGMVPTERKP